MPDAETLKKINNVVDEVFFGRFARIEEEYRKNLKNMDMQSESAITKSFVGTAVSVAKRFLSVPEIADILRLADSNSFTMFNPQNQAFS